MKDYLLFMDVSGDIDASYVNNGDIHLIPMDLVIDDKITTYTADDNGMNLNEFYHNIKKNKIVKTSQINPQIYEDYLSPYLEKGYSCLYLGLSKGLSSTYQSSVIASQNLKEKYPDVDMITIDTDAVTALLGLLAERMIENKKSGMTLEENVKDLNNVKTKLTGFAIVDDLKALKRGGRISSAIAFAGAILNIKPIISIANGTLFMYDKQKGTKKAILKVANAINDDIDTSFGKTIYIVDGCEEDSANELEQELKNLMPNLTIKRKLLSPIIGAHLGKGALVVAYYGK